MPTEPDLTGEGTPGFETWPAVTQIQTDRCCDGCGYNLHRQIVRREPRTRVLMARCPECGRFDPASDLGARAALWLRRLAAVLMVSWAVIVVSGALGLGFTQGVTTYLTLDELTTYSHQDRRGSWVNLSEPMLSPYIWEVPRRRHELYAITGSMSFGLGFVGTLLALVVVPHWRRARYIDFLLAWAVLPALIVGLIWWVEAPRLFRWGLAHIAGHAGVFLAGGLIALLVGRPLIRLGARVCLTPRMRAVIESAWSHVEPGAGKGLAGNETPSQVPPRNP
jgi:hypothetical protein